MAEADLRLLLRTIADTKGAEQTSAALRRVQQDAKQADATSQQMVAGLARQAAGFLSVATAASALGSVYSGAITAARENERVTRATAAAYGESAQQFERFASVLSTQTGFTSQAILEAALSARTLTANYGLTIQQTQELIRASADLARVRGIGVAEAFERVQSAIRGEAEASEYLGLTLNDTFIKNNALNGSLKTTFERMTDAQKAQVRYNEVLRQTATFQGLAKGSADSLDTAMLKVEASTNKAQLALGKAVAPPTITGLKVAANAMGLLADNADLVVETLAGLSPILSGLGRLRDDLQRFDIGGGQARAAASASAERAQARVRALNELTTPVAALGEVFSASGASVTERAAAARAGERQMQSLREIAYLDQRDAAVRDLLAAQREEVALKEQVTQLEKQHGDMAQRRLQIELASIGAQQRALPAQYALQDTERAIERARLVLGIRGTSAAERSAARGTIRGLSRDVLPGQRLGAFDAETGVIAAARAAQGFDMSARVAAIGAEQGLAGLVTLANVAAARTDAAQTRLEQIVQQALSERAQKPVHVTLQVLGSDGSMIYEELIEATDQAQMPPVVRVSGVRR